MKQKVFGWVLSGCTAVGAAAGILLVGTQMGSGTAEAGGRVIWVGCLFLLMFVLGFIGLQLAMFFDKSYQVEQPPHRWLAALVACVLLFGIGAGGQYLFMRSTETVSHNAEVDIVLLLDVSSSMQAVNFDTPRDDAACEFVDSLNESTHLQVMTFASKVIETTQLLKMDDAGKNSHKQMINSIDATGTTDFVEPLQDALESLKTQGRPDCDKAVIMLTDGTDSVTPISSSLVNEYKDAGIRFFSIRLDFGTYLSADAQALADMANQTGGFDKLLIPDANCNIDTAEMLDAFQSAFAATSETKVTMGEDLLVYSKNSLSTWQFILRLLVIALCAVIIGFGYFGKLTLPTALGNALLGAAAGGLISLVEPVGFFLCATVLCLLVGTAYVFLNFGAEDRYDV